MYTLADRVAEMKDETLSNKQIEVDSDALVNTLTDRPAEEEIEIIGNKMVEVLVDTLAHSLAQVESNKLADTLAEEEG